MPLKTELSFISEYNAVLKDFLIHDCGISKRLLAKLKRCENGITVNGVQSKVTVKIKPGDIVVLLSKDSEGFLEGNSELDVPKVFENESLVVYDKPVGMPVHPSVKHQGDTLGTAFPRIIPASDSDLSTDLTGIPPDFAPPLKTRMPPPRFSAGLKKYIMP